VAPTKPLVAQQIEACHQSCGIPGTDAIELTGQIPRDVRSAYVSALIYVPFSTHGMLSGKLSACFI
jgi:ERCC4-related helicase